MQSFLLHWNFLQRIRNHFKLSYTNDKVGGMIKSLDHDLFSIVVIQPFTPIYSFRLGLNLSIIGKFRFFCRSYREFYFSIYITQKTQHLKGILENIKLTVVKVMAVLIFNNNFYFQMQQPMLIMFSKLLMWHLVALSVLRFVKIF